MLYHHNISEDTILATARALMKFCRDHQYPKGGLTDLGHCIAALEKEDFRASLIHFQKMSFGGMCRFDDWYPPVVYEHEDKLYVSAVFEALVYRFQRLFLTASGKKIK